LRIRPWRTSAAALAAFALTLAAAPAFGDQVLTPLGANGNTSIALSGGTAQTTINYFVDADGPCDISSADKGEFNVVIGAPAGVTASPSHIVFSACGVNVPVTFTATAAGDRLVTLSQTAGPNSLNEHNADFTLHVAASTNTAPTVTVAGPSGGASYEFGSVPAASCSVTDAQDPSPTADPVISAVTGPKSAYGLGSQTVTCSYTDTGGLSDTDSVTYTIVDTTKPVLNTPGDQTLQATSSAGAEATWSVSGSDNVFLADASCDVTSPHTFDLGSHLVSCTATDEMGLTTTGSFTIKVVDTTKPSLTVAGDKTVEATGPGGAVVTYADPTATDNYDTVLSPSCTPPSGSTFPLGANPVSCSVTDSSNNTETGGFTITVRDTTPPTVTVPADITVEATGPSGAVATFSVSASDIVDGSTNVTCNHASGDTFPLGTTTVSCSSTDAHLNTGHGSFTVTVEDTTPPVIDAHADVTGEATGSSGASVSYTTPGATDVVDGAVTVGCIPASPVLVAVDATQAVTCTATDAAGNPATSTFDLKVVDTTAPTLNLPGNISVAATSAAGAVVNYTASGTDLVDGTVGADCSKASGSTFAPGTTTVTCTTSDSHSNTSAPGSFTVTVSFGFNGFFAPVDNGGVFNIIKGGQSVPLKWALPNGSGGWIGDLSVVASIRQVGVSCSPTAPTDDIEAPTSGASALRYDTTANQYIYNWQSPKGANVCYKVTVNLTDGTAKSALFKTK
jgi:large repetitive protein